MDYRKKGALVLTSLLEDLEVDGCHLPCVANMQSDIDFLGMDGHEPLQEFRQPL